MTLADYLAVTIGLVLTYTVLSLIASQLKEARAGFLQLRAAQLEAGLISLLTIAVQQAGTAPTFKQSPWERLLALFQPILALVTKPAPAVPAPVVPAPAAVAPVALAPNPEIVAPESNSAPVAPATAAAHDPKAIFTMVYAHPLVSEGANPTKPFFIPARSFTLALLSAIGDGEVGATVVEINTDIGNLPTGSKLRTTLEALSAGATDEVESLRAAIDGWFNASMDVLSSQYKANVQRWTLVIGIVLAVAFNVDTINIAGTLLSSADLRTKITSQANAMAAQDQTNVARDATSQKSLTGLIEQLEALPIPAGWPVCGTIQPCPSPVTSFWTAGTLGWLLRIVGWLLTGAAISLGAPFWFDLLHQLVGRSPAKSDTPA